MAKFKDAFDFMFPHEVIKGNIHKITSDAGGKTKYGISFNFLKHLSLSEGDIDHDGVITEKDICVLTVPQATALYSKHFWNPIHGDALVAQLVANKVFDMAVNMGVPQATILLQRSIQSLGLYVKDDAVFGPKTLAATNAQDSLKLTGMLRQFSVAYYEQIRTHRFVSLNEYNSWMVRAAA